MSTPMVVDARGLSCPEPVLMVQEALAAAGGAAITVMVSSPTARENVKNLLEQSGRTVAEQPITDGWQLAAT